jgi:sialate O-acetylesterase
MFLKMKKTSAGRPNEYAEVLSTFIKVWGKLWCLKEIHFLCVQLPNFMEVRKVPLESYWALLREQQLKILSVPNTACLVTLGLGERNDIHPLRKKEIGQRLALAAENRVYGDKNVVYSVLLINR